MGTPRSVQAWRLTPSGTGHLEPGHLTSHAGMFASSALARHRSITLLVVREAHTQSSYVVMDTGADNRAIAEQLATTLAASITGPTEDVDLSRTPAISVAHFRRGGVVMRETQAGIDPSQIARMLASALSPGEWVALTLRKVSRTESRRHARWLGHRMGTSSPTHHSTGTSAVMATLWAGGRDQGGNDALIQQVAAAMPGFDLDVRSTPVRTAPLGAALMTAGLAAWGALGFYAHLWPAAVAAGLAGVALAGAAWAGWLPTLGARVRRGLPTGMLPAPPRRLGSPRAPRQASTTAEGVVQPQSDGDYPLASSVFRLGAHLPIGLLAPHAGAVTGGTSTKVRPVPPLMRDRIGPYLGTDADGGSPAYLSAADRHGGVFITGRMGSGKTELLMSIYGWDCLDRVRPSGLPGSIGARNTLIAFENKGEGALKYQAFALAAGDTPVIIEVADPNSWGIDMFAIPGTWRERGDFFAATLKYVLDDGAIGPASFMALGSFARAALALTETAGGKRVLADAPTTDPGMSVMALIYVMLGGLGDDAACELNGAVIAEAARLERKDQTDTDLADVIEALRPYYGPGTTPSSRRDKVTAPQNKIYALLGVDHWWSPTRRKGSWDSIINSHANVIINTGPAVVAGRSDLLVADEVSNQLSGMLMFTLQKAIERNCSGWRDQGRAISPFADELSLLAGTSPAVIEWIHDKGRSFGLRPTWATQRPTQLHQQVRESVMDYSALVAFTQAGAEVAAPLVADLGADGSPWEVADLITLLPYTAAVRAAVGERRQPAFTLKTHYYAADLPGFPAAQGWPVIEGETRQ